MANDSGVGRITFKADVRTIRRSNLNGAEVGLILLAGNHHIERARGRDVLGEVHSSHTRCVGHGNTIDDRAVVGDSNVGTGRGVNSDGGGTRGYCAGYRHGVGFRFGDVRHHGTIAKGVVELEVIVGRVVAVAISDGRCGITIGDSLLHSKVAKIQQRGCRVPVCVVEHSIVNTGGRSRCSRVVAC